MRLPLENGPLPGDLFAVPDDIRISIVGGAVFVSYDLRKTGSCQFVMYAGARFQSPNKKEGQVAVLIPETREIAFCSLDLLHRLDWLGEGPHSWG